MEKYNITGMSCAACSSHVENAVRDVSGVSSVSVNLLTNSMNVEGTASESDIVHAVEKAGYGAAVASGVNTKSSVQDNSLKDTETPALLKRLIASVAFLLPLMYVSMGNVMWNWPVPPFLKANPIAIAIYEMLFAIIIIFINRKFFINGFKSAIHLAPN